MFGRKAPAPCDNWLGLRQYNDNKSISKVVWVDKQFEKIVQANKQALKSIQARAKVNERSSGDKDFDIPIEILSYSATIRKARTRFKMTISWIYLRSLVNIPTQMHFCQALRRKRSGQTGKPTTNVRFGRNRVRQERR